MKKFPISRLRSRQVFNLACRQTGFQSCLSADRFSIFLLFSFLLFIYMVWPSPSAIADFKSLPNSQKSRLEGDTIQIPNVAAYFSNHYREFVVPFYAKNYRLKVNLPIPPLRLNHPPEFSWITIKKHTDSTYLEELVYPLRDSLFVNGYEPFYPDGSPKFWGSTKFEVDGNLWETKTTLRFYHSSIWIRLLVWFGITLSIFLLYKMTKKIIFNK
ncbi:hypothetical protein HYZ05_02690 [Candidatus Daviesbacteria bacterium]|nr:hypothetical protein [Candidatus Daviesbacteria bacterium]